MPPDRGPGDARRRRRRVTIRVETPVGSCNAVGHRLKMLRHRLRKTQKEIAEAAGVAPSQLSKIENGEIANPGFHTVEKIVSAMGAKLSDL